jgi:acyl-ACP thioesterase
MDVVWERKLKIHWDSTDQFGRLSLPGLGQLLISTAVEHDESLGFGYRHLRKENLNWVLFRMNFEILRFPLWDEEIRVITWPSGVQGLLGLREFQIKDLQGKELVKVSSEWMIIDLEKRRPKRLNQFTDVLKYKKTEKVLTSEPLEPNDKGHFKDLFSVTIRHADLDLNGHATAKRYFEWIDDSLFEVLGESGIRNLEKIQVTFLHEAYLHEKVALQVDEKLTTVRGLKNDGKTVFMAVVKIK